MNNTKRENDVISGYGLFIGDRVKILEATNGATGANGLTGIVVKNRETHKSRYDIHGLLYDDKETLMVKCDNGQFWRVGKHGKYMLRNNKFGVETIDVIYKGKETKAIFGDKVGVATCNLSKDMYDSRYGAIISIARAMNFGEDKVQGIIDILFDDVKLEGFSEEELLDEIVNRRVKRQS